MQKSSKVVTWILGIFFFVFVLGFLNRSSQQWEVTGKFVGEGEDKQFSIVLTECDYKPKFVDQVVYCSSRKHMNGTIYLVESVHSVTYVK